MKAGVQRFAPHVRASDRRDAGDAGARAICSAVRRGGVCQRRRGGARPSCSRASPAIEYRHAPDTAEIERVLVPLIKAADGARRRRGKESVVKISECNWQQIEALSAQRRSRGSAARQHRAARAAVASRSTRILSERVAAEAAEPLGVPVFPVVAYGLTPYFVAYPGIDHACASRPMCGSSATSSTACSAGLPPHPDRQRPWRQPAGEAWRSSGWPTIRRAR